MNKQKIFMTGGTSGLGVPAALNFVNNGADLIVAARSESKKESLIKKLSEKYPNAKGRLSFVTCDLGNFDSINTACSEVLKNHSSLDMIINNAGIMSFEEQKSSDGIEETFHVNVLAPTLIAHLLSPLLLKSENAKIINTASALHKGNIDFDNIEHKGKFKSFKTYSQSKLGIILLSRLWAQGTDQTHIDVYAQHPGIVKSDLSRNAGWLSRTIFNLMGKSAEKGAETLIHVASESKSKLENGAYYANKKVTKTTDESYNMETAKRLSDVCKSYLSDYITSSSPIFS